MRIYTIGHSNHSIDEFIALLEERGIGALVDVRSQPYSRHVPHFNGENLAREVIRHGLAYWFMGHLLGGRPSNKSALLPDGSPDYERMRTDPDYQRGINELLARAVAQPVAIMCSEGDHHHCHRYHLITPTLLARGVTVLHIQPDGSLVNAAEEPRQLSLF